MKYIISVDPGLQGYLSLLGYTDILRDKSFVPITVIETVPMPTKVIVTKEEVTKFKYKDPKVVIKSGPKKGERQRIIKTPKKTRTILDLEGLKDKLEVWNLAYTVDTLVTEATVIGIMSKGSMTAIENISMLKGMAYALGIHNQFRAHPSTWKKAVGVDKDKESSILAVKNLIGFNTDNHDEAESILIGFYFLNFK